MTASSAWAVGAMHWPDDEQSQEPSASGSSSSAFSPAGVALPASEPFGVGAVAAGSLLSGSVDQAELPQKEFSFPELLEELRKRGFGSTSRKDVVRLLWASCHLRVQHDELLQPASAVDVAFLVEILTAKRTKVRSVGE